jgi:hypothetical protein
MDSLLFLFIVLVVLGLVYYAYSSQSKSTEFDEAGTDKNLFKLGQGEFYEEVGDDMSEN